MLGIAVLIRVEAIVAAVVLCLEWFYFKKIIPKLVRTWRELVEQNTQRTIDLFVPYDLIQGFFYKVLHLE